MTAQPGKPVAGVGPDAGETALASSAGERTTNGDKQVGWKVALLTLLISVLWGANIVALKIALAVFPPLWGAFWRMGIGMVVTGLWAKFSRIRLRPAPEEYGGLALLGILCFIQISLLNISVNWTSAAYAVVLINCHPIFTNLLAHYFIPGNRLSWTRVLGLAIAVAGISFIFLGKPEARWAPHPYWGNLIAVVSSFFVGVRSIATKRIVQRIETTRAIFWTLVLAVPMFLVAALLFEPPLVAPLAWRPVAAILYQGVVVAGFCFMLWTRLLRDYPPGVLSVLAFPTPLFGVLFSAVVFSEALPPSFLIGAGAVFAGILIVTTRSRQSSLPAPSAAGQAAHKASGQAPPATTC